MMIKPHNALLNRALMQHCGGSRHNSSGVCIGLDAFEVGASVWVCGDRSKNIAMVARCTVEQGGVLKLVTPFDSCSSLQLFASALRAGGSVASRSLDAFILQCRWEHGALTGPIDQMVDLKRLAAYSPPARPAPEKKA